MNHPDKKSIETENPPQRISFIITASSADDILERCLQSVYKTTIADIFNVVILDNLPNNPVSEFFHNKQFDFPNLTVIPFKNNRKMTDILNEVIGAVKGRLIVLLNSDLELQPGWYENGITEIQSNRETALISGRIVDREGKIVNVGMDFEINPDSVYSIWLCDRNSGENGDCRVFQKKTELLMTDSDFLIIDQTQFNEVGQFDISYNNRFGKIDLCFKLRTNGKKILYHPECSATLLTNNQKETDVLVDHCPGESAKIFYKKWESEISTIALDRLIENVQGDFVFLKDALEPGSAKILRQYLYEISYHIAGIFKKLGPIYVHFGGIGDACLLLSTFYDKNPEQVVLSIPNSIPAARSFYSNFPKLKKVIFLPYPKFAETHSVYRQIFYQIKNVRGIGATPLKNYDEEWASGMDIFQKYGISKSCEWAKAFRCSKVRNFQIVLNPQGSTKGMVKGKFNKLNPVFWKPLINFLNQKNIIPIIIGIPEEAEEYPAIGKSIDKRSYNFREQMELIASSDLLVGTDTWGKTFAALAEVPCIIFRTMRSKEMVYWKDPSDHVFIDPWEKITQVKNLNHFKKSFNSRLTEYHHQIRKGETLFGETLIQSESHPISVIWEGSQFVNHSLAHVNREQAIRLIEAGFELSILPYETDQFKPDPNSPYMEISKRISRKLRTVDIHVRHQWPPKLEPPPEGHWVVIQPWEFGHLPQNWVAVFNEKVDEMWVPSSHVRRVYINSGIAEDRIFVIPNGIAPDKYHPNAKPYQLKTKKSFKFLFVGGTIFRKGIDILLDVYLKMFSHKDDVCLVIKDMGGDSFYKGQNIRERIRDFQSNPDSPEIEYIDKILPEKDLIGLYTACNTLVHPYRGEGFGLPILEAMACGLPVIVTNGGACLDFCNETNSFLIDAKQIIYPEKLISGMELTANVCLFEPDKQDLYRKMRYAFNNAKEIRKTGELASQSIRQNFSWEKSSELVQNRIKILVEKPIYREKVYYEKHYQQARRFLELNDPSAAQKIYEQLYSSTQSEEALYGLALCAKKDEQSEEAAKILQKLLAMNSNHAEASNLLGVLSFEKQDFKSAKSLFLSAIERNPDFIDAQRNYAETLIADEQYDEGVQYYFKIITKNPDDILTLTRISLLYIEIGKYSDALRIARKIKSLDSNNNEANGIIQICNQYLDSNEMIIDESKNPTIVDIITKDQPDSYEKISCPFCNSGEAIRYRDSADIVRCVNCNTVYLRTRLTIESMERLYQSYGSEGFQQIPASEEEVLSHPMRRDDILAEILEFIKPQGKMLDIGCCWGAFLHNARSRGFNVEGVEITQQNAEYARSHLNINVKTGQFINLPFQSNSYDLVTMLHVLEHIPYSKKALSIIYNILKPGGMFCGIVPNIKSFLSIALKENWYWLDPNYHYLHFSPDILKRELLKTGFQIERIYTCCGDYGEEDLNRVIEKMFNVNDPEIIAQVVSIIEANEAGEEIRFFVRKPTMDMVAKKVELNIDRHDDVFLKRLIQQAGRVLPDTNYVSVN